MLVLQVRPHDARPKVVPERLALTVTDHAVVCKRGAILLRLIK